jgi:hypothetical protein
MNFIQTLAISALPIIFAITLHEAAHGYAARHFGDSTAWQMGRISLNPIRHVDHGRYHHRSRVDSVGKHHTRPVACCSAGPSRCR